MSTWRGCGRASKRATTRLGTFEGGFQKFSDLFAEKLRDAGVEIRLGTQVKFIKRNQDKGLSIAAGKVETFDKVLVTTSPNLLARLCPDLPENYLKGLLELKSMGAVVMVISLNRQLSEQVITGLHLPKDAGYPMLALVEHTNLCRAKFWGRPHWCMPAIIWN